MPKFRRLLSLLVPFVFSAAFIGSTAYADQLSYVPLAQPCRLLDTRTSTGGLGPLIAGTTYLFGTDTASISSAAQHGNATGCGIPAGIEAISMNLNMLNASSSGNITTWNPDTGAVAPNSGTGVYNPAVEVQYNTGYTSVPVGSPLGTNPGKFYLRVASGQIDMTINIVGYWVSLLPYATTQSYSGSLFSVTNTDAGSGNVATFVNSSTSNTANVLQVTGVGPGVIANHSQGNAGNFFMNNTSGVGAGIRGEVNSIFGNNGTAGVYGVSSGTGGYGGYFEHSNSSGFGIALYANTNGQGTVANFVTLPSNNSQPTLSVQNSGTGSAATIISTNSSDTANILNVTAIGPGVIADHSQGNVGNFFMNNTSGVGAGVRGEVNSIFGNNGTAGVYGVASGTGGYAGYFEHSEVFGFGIALYVTTNDQGTAMVVNQNGSGGDPAIFQRSGFNVARIDRNGKIFADGNFQASGADVAEFVPTSGATPLPGDVVEIDPTSPDTFRLAAEASSTRVAGVISSVPGLTLNDKTGATKASEGPALALAGRVPVKVTNINGAIHVGDLLVSSSIPGHAMRAGISAAPGTVIGKALAEFDAHAGVMPMLVWTH